MSFPSHLQWLYLAHNYFCMSQIPSTILQLASSTHLHLSYSGLSGLVPQEISHLSKLVSLDLSGNDLQNLAMKRLVQNMTTFKGCNAQWGRHVSCLLLWYLSI